MAGNFATWLNTVTLPEFSDLVMKQFSHQKEMVQPAAAQLFVQEDLTGWGSDSKRFDEVDIETFAKLKRQGENSQKAKAGIGYNKTMYAKRYAMEINVSWEYRRYSQQYATQVKADLVNLNHFVPQRFELNLSHVFSFATSTAYTDMDGESIDVSTGDALALAYSAHTLAHSASTYRNRVNGDPVMSQGALEAGESLFVTDILSNFGERRVLRANKVFTSDDPNTCRTLKQILNSTADIDAAHAGVENTYKGKYTHVELPYLATTATGARDATKKRWWGIIAAYGNPTNSLQAYYGVFEGANMKSPAAGNNGEDFSNDDWKYGVRGSMGQCVLSGRGLVMSCPSS
uniref:Capsid protein n=1 Tax=viral metagenome TaxID=1070528 RepID=A0A6H1ZW60_9ZZZZ